MRSIVTLEVETDQLDALAADMLVEEIEHALNRLYFQPEADDTRTITVYEAMILSLAPKR